MRGCRPSTNLSKKRQRCEKHIEKKRSNEQKKPKKKSSMGRKVRCILGKNTVSATGGKRGRQKGRSDRKLQTREGGGREKKKRKPRLGCDIVRSWGKKKQLDERSIKKFILGQKGLGGRKGERSKRNPHSNPGEGESEARNTHERKEVAYGED